MTPLRTWTGRIFVGGLAPVSIYGSRFAANIILSRLLVPDQFGTAVAISAVLGLGSLATDMALDRFVVIDGTERSLSTAHLLAAVIGLVLAAILYTAAPVVAGLFGVPNFAESFALAAAISAIGGFANLGLKQIQRNYRYGPDAIAQVSSNVVGLVALFIAATLLRNHRAIIIGLGVQSALYVLLSHALAPTRYAMSFEKRILSRALSFGLPLTLNGIGLATVSQLDRILVGHWLGVKELGLYAIVFSMSVVPTNLIISTLSGPSLSYLLSEDNEASTRASRYRLLLTLYSLVTGLYACWLALSLDVLVPLIFGSSYSLSSHAHVLFVLISSMRLLRSGAPTALLLATGKTKRLALLNLSAGIGLVVASACITVWPGLEAMLFGIAIGEVIACTLFFTLLDPSIRRSGNVVADLLASVSVPVLISVVLALNPDRSWLARGSVLLIGTIAFAGQLYFELLRNDGLRARFAELPFIGARLQSFLSREVCPD